MTSEYVSESITMQICIHPPGKQAPIPVTTVQVPQREVSMPSQSPVLQSPPQQQLPPPQQYQQLLPSPPQQLPQQQYTQPPPQQQPQKRPPSYIATRSPLNPTDLGPSSIYSSTTTSSQLGYPSDVAQYY